MKKRSSHASFLEQLKKSIASLKDMKPDDMHILTVHANYGNYEIVIGPEQHEGGEDDHRRTVEINGEIHHLFITPDQVSPNPSHEQVHEKLRNTVIMQDLSVHLRDRDGDGTHAEQSNGAEHGVQPRGMINMAGKKGEEIVLEMERDGRLNDITYHIIQEDILHALDRRREEEEPTIEL